MMDPGASGSGLLDLTREGDDTSLGANLLEDVYGGEKPSADAAPGEAAPGASAGGALFEHAGVASDVGAGLAVAGMAVVAVESYDGPWSGILGGLALGMVAVLGTMLVIILMGIVGVSGLPPLALFATNLWMWVGILGAAPVAFAIIGWALTRNG